MSEQAVSVDFTSFSEADRIAFAAALFAIAAADGSLDREELGLIFDTLVLDGLSAAARKEIQGYLITPPPLNDALEQLAHADETLRYSLLLLLTDIALADDVLTMEEGRGLWVAQRKLGLPDTQMQAILQFCRQMRALRVRGLDDHYAADVIKRAAAGLRAAGVPIAAIYFSGSVVGLSAAGITSGLAALGLGGLLGLSAMVTGIGVVALVGAGISRGVSHVLDSGGQQEKDRQRERQERKAQLVMTNLQDAINGLIEQILALQTDVAANRATLLTLKDRLHQLQDMLKQRCTAMNQAG